MEIKHVLPASVEGFEKCNFLASHGGGENKLHVLFKTAFIRQMMFVTLKFLQHTRV